MSSDRLRETARVLRERAGAVLAHDHRTEIALDNFIDYYENRRLTTDTLGIDAHYIATMHPGVGLALADWLDAQSRHIAMYYCDAHCEPDGCDETKAALALADLILGGESS